MTQNTQMSQTSTAPTPRALWLVFVVVCVFCVVCVSPLTMLAQGTATIRGQIIQPDSLTPAQGAIVVALDSVGNEVARSLSGDQGSYTLTVSAPARYSLRALRIGFRPTLVPIFDVAAGETKSIRIVLAGVAVQLATVRVQDVQGSCRISADTGRLIGDLWEQARGVLTASTLSAGQRPFEATLALYNQFTPLETRSILAETLQVVRRTSTSGFVSVPAEQLAALGYVTVFPNEVSYHAPDAHALLSPSFAATHCFDVKAGGTANPDWIGIGFRPATRRAGISEVEGTLWLDRGSAELRRLDFEYVNLPRNAAGETADGHVVFVRLLTGDWIVSRWVIRTPQSVQEIGGGRASRFKYVGRRVVGGMTREVRQDGIQLFRDAGASLTVTLSSREPMNSVRGAYVGLVGSMHEARADSNGVATLTGMPEGTYRIVVATDFLTRIGARAIESEATVAFNRPAQVTVPLPSVEQAIETACGAPGRARLVFGTLQDPGRNAVVGAEVIFEWTEFRMVGVGRRAMRTPTRAQRSVMSDSEGRWNICVPTGGGLEVSVKRGGNPPVRIPTPAIVSGRNRIIALIVP
jgi:hypothetical protein